jgi:taurine dioxygenase
MDLDWQPLTGPFGAQLSGPADALRGEDILQALHRYQLLVFPAQSLDAAEFTALAGKLGELDRYPFAAPLPESEFVVPIIKEAGDTHNFGGDWHSDTSYLSQPPSATLLLARELPEQGGDTLFADMYGAFAGLSAGLQSALIGLDAVNTSSLVHDPNGDHAQVAGDASGVAAATESATHPVVRKHPATGRPALYISLVHTQRFAGMTRPESLPLLEFLQQRAVSAENCVRLQWQPGTLAIWDNRCLQHLPLNDYPGKRRVMHRIILRGEKPQSYRTTEAQ